MTYQKLSQLYHIGKKPMLDKPHEVDDVVVFVKEIFLQERL